MSGYNLVDAAVARPLQSRSVNPAIIGQVLPRGVGQAFVGQDVIKAGRTTEVTTGTVIAINATVVVGPYYDSNFGVFSQQIITTGMSAGGDSGSLLMDRELERRRAPVRRLVRDHDPQPHRVRRGRAGRAPGHRPQDGLTGWTTLGLSGHERATHPCRRRRRPGAARAGAAPLSQRRRRRHGDADAWGPAHGRARLAGPCQPQGAGERAPSRTSCCPREIEGVPVDVLEAGQIRPL